MKKNKGFTLIELLAVIVILSIIALIATPLVLKYIDKARDGARERSAENYLRAVENEVVARLLKNNTNLNTSCNIKENGNLECNSKEISVSIKGTKPTGGVITFDGEKIIGANILIDGSNYDLNISGDLDNINLSYKCKRATVLHEEKCNSIDGQGCLAAGYSLGETIKYGSLGEKGILNSGDAFDCDVNGDGIYNSTNERFYFVSDYYDTTNKNFKSDYATLIYYNNTNLGLPDNSVVMVYDNRYENWHGPVDGITYLPNTQQWSNVSLLNSGIRAIINQSSGSITAGGTLPNNFSYSSVSEDKTISYSSRFLTLQEVNKGCNSTSVMYKLGALDKCNYLLENTSFTEKSLINQGYWLENSYQHNSRIDLAWFIHASVRYASDHTVNVKAYAGVRPVIEVLKSDILY